MSTMHRDKSNTPIEKTVAAFGKELCDACGGKSDAYWSGRQTLAVCYRCAISVLPSLIADAMRGPRPEH